MTAAYEVGECILKVSDVSLTLGGNLILRNVDLEVKNLKRPGFSQGQVVGLLGPSGIGKTRLFRILAGLDAPDTGEVLIGPEQKPVERGMVGVVAQHYPLFAHRRVLGNLVVAGKQAGLSASESRQKAESLLKQFGLEQHGNKFPAILSGGQRQRTAIAQQFMCSEHYLLMDEPFSGLDVIAIDAVSRFICEVASAHDLNTMIVVTHDIVAAIEVCDTILLLGRDRDANDNIIPGARIQKTYDLAARGLAWRDNVATTPEALALLKEIREEFPRL